MSIDDAIFNGTVSMISALIGGCLALRGTRLAIKHEKEKDREAKEEQARPFFEMIDYSDSRIGDANRIVLNFSKEDNYSENEPTLSGFIIKATPHNSRRTACLNLIPSACPKNLGKATALPQFICTT